MRKRKNSAPKKAIAFGIIAVLAILVGIGVVIEQNEKGRGKPPPKTGHKQTAKTGRPLSVVKEYALPELLIKGCLFDLGINRQDIRFMGYTVQVTARGLPPEDLILKAFEPLEDAGKVSLASPGRLVVEINGVEWDIIFAEAAGNLAKCAIIIDDMGQSLQIAEQLGGIDANLTFAVLPDLPDTRQVAEYLHGKGREVLLHLPMQGNGKNPGPGAILEGMSRAMVRSVLEEDLKKVPFISGVNNHMGSVITTDPGDMRLVFSELKHKGLFFVDSKTTSKSVCENLARDFKVPFIARDVFLDNELNDAYITGQIRKLVSISLKHSSAVAICHPHPETIAVLQREIPKLKGLGVEVVGVSSLMGKPGNVQ
jgi:polysaccharide deacetylase 2 family uncharacterized protein YibQ